ncbi:MAG: hypothetical protein AAGG48_30115 [Planctomycetota bacterium]
MELKADFPTARLCGPESTLLAIQYRREEEPVPGAHVAELHAHLSSPNSTPAIDQPVETWTYSRPCCDDLRQLLDGDSTITFQMGGHNFGLTIYEHSWGVRYGFVAECDFSTIKWTKFAPWPKRRKIGDYLLDDNPIAGCLRFAFVCNYDDLRIFLHELSAMVDKNRLPISE